MLQAEINIGHPSLAGQHTKLYNSLICFSFMLDNLEESEFKSSQTSKNAPANVATVSSMPKVNVPATKHTIDYGSSIPYLSTFYWSYTKTVCFYFSICYSYYYIVFVFFRSSTTSPYTWLPKIGFHWNNS